MPALRPNASKQLDLFISKDIETPASLVQSKVGLRDYSYKTLLQLRSGFDEVGNTLTTILGAGTHASCIGIDQPNGNGRYCPRGS